MLTHAAAVHFTSVIERDEARALGLIFRDAIIPLGVETDGAATALSDPKILGRQRALFLSRLDPKKNFEALIDAFASSPALRDSTVLIVAGSGEKGYVDTLVSHIETAGISDCIFWLGHVDGAQKASVFAAADIFILPSFSENFGIAAVEAMLAGVPCVLSRGVAIANAAVAAGAAIVVEPKADDIAAALAKALSDPSRLRDMSIRAREFAAQEYSPEIMARRLIALYESIVAR
jgi:glycosyltransferase involved in cell wall biosynthesis